MVKVAVVQMTSTNSVGSNLAKMKRFVEQAAKQRAKIVAFPEMAYFMGKTEEWKPLLAGYDEHLELFGQWAKEFNVYLIPGTIREPVKGSADHYFNTLGFFGPKGNLLAKYRKIFLFKANLPDRVYNEAEFCQAGNMTVTCDDAPAVIGFSICFDIRFPESYRALKRQGAQIVFCPSAFTVPTGTAHWQALAQARAIENQFFMVAPAQVGKLGDGRDTYGHSLVISPWGDVLTNMEGGEGISVVDLDLEAIRLSAQRVDSWASRRDDLFKI